MEKLNDLLREAILNNEGDRDDILSDVMRLIQPMVVALNNIQEPQGAYSKDRLTHAENTIEWCKEQAQVALAPFQDESGENLVKMVVSLDITTNRSVEEITAGIRRGIYKGLDTEPHYIATPSDVKINYILER